MKTLLIVTDRTLHSAPRVIREINALGKHYRIHTIGRTAPRVPVESHTDSQLLRNSLLARAFNRIQRDLFGRYVPFIERYPLRQIRFERLLHRIKPDIVLCHEPFDLPYFAALKKKYGFKLVFNAHEYYPLEFDDRPGWDKTWQVSYETLYRKTLPDVDLMINVCESIREKCLEVFGKDSLVIANAAEYHDMSPKPIQEKIRLIHHGAAIQSRKIELMIRVAELLGSDYTLDLMVMPTDKPYFDRIAQLASTVANVRMIDPVPFEQIVAMTNTYDIGIFLLAPTNYNYTVALPNKLFEFIQGRVAIAIGPSPEMARFVREFDLGIISPDFTPETLADLIRSCPREELMRFKHNADKAARPLSAEHYAQRMLHAFLELSHPA